ncbi:unnamed protein product, partial [Closterium sp. NIES-65]
PTALGPAPDDTATARFARQRADRTAWTSRDAAACIALSSLLPESEEVHFTQVRTAAAYLTAIKARYSTPATVSLGRLFLPFLFPDLASFERSADLIAHLRSLDASYRAACTEAQLALLPPPMAITVYFIATSLPDRLASVRDALLLKHPSELTIEVLESALKDVESNLRSVAAASGTVSPPLFHGCTVPQLPTFTASLATAATDATAAAVTTASRSRGRGARKVVPVEVEAEVAEVVGVLLRLAVVGVQRLERPLVQRLVTPLHLLVAVTLELVSRLLYCRPR